jgi:hypothetical protein
MIANLISSISIKSDQMIQRLVKQLNTNKYYSQTGVVGLGWQNWVGIGLHFLDVGTTLLPSSAPFGNFA